MCRFWEMTLLRSNDMLTRVWALNHVESCFWMVFGSLRSQVIDGTPFECYGAHTDVCRARLPVLRDCGDMERDFSIHTVTFPTLGSLFQLSVFTFDFGQSYPCCYLTAACAIGQKLSISKRSASGVLCSISSLLQVPLAKSAAGYVQGSTSDIFRWIMMDSCPTSSFDQFRGLLCASVHCPTRHVAHLSLPGWMPSWSDWSLQCRSSHVTYARTQRYQDTNFMHYDGIILG